MQKNNKKITNAWAMYDWANSVYSLVITSTIFPIYYSAVTKDETSDLVIFFGYKLVNTSLYSYALSFSFFMAIIITPFLSSLADYSGMKKQFMQFFSTLGALSCSALYFFNGNNIEYGIICFIVASFGYTASLVFYNAYLPEIATEDKQDQLSAKGFALGYLGSSLLLIVNLIMIQKPDWFGITQDGFGARFSFLLVGLWWIGFGQLTFSRLPKNVYNKPEGNNYLLNGYRELQKVWKQLNQLRYLQRYVFTFFFFSMGVQTVMYVAALFGEKELKLASGELITTILIIQFVAIGGAYLFSFLSSKYGNIRTLIMGVIIWIGICIGAYFVHDAFGFYILAFVVGMVMGGIQALSRSTYSKLLPETQDHASYFSFYDVTEKLSIVIGTASYGLIEEFTGNMRNSIVTLILFFVFGLIGLVGLKNRKV